MSLVQPVFQSKPGVPVALAVRRMPLRFEPSGAYTTNTPTAHAWRAAADTGCTGVVTTNEARQACGMLFTSMVERARMVTSSTELASELINELGDSDVHSVLAARPSVLDALLAADTAASHAVLLAHVRDADEGTVDRVLLGFSRCRHPPAAWDNMFKAWVARGRREAVLARGSLARRLSWQQQDGAARTIAAQLLDSLSGHLMAGREQDAIVHVHALTNARHHGDWRWLAHCTALHGNAQLAREARRAMALLPKHVREHVLQLQPSSWEPGVPLGYASPRVVDVSLVPWCVPWPLCNECGEDMIVADAPGAAAALYDPPTPYLNQTFGATYGSGTANVEWSAKFVDNAYFTVEPDVSFDAYSINELELTASVFDFRVPLASASLDFELRAFTNAFTVIVFGETVYWRPLPCVACFFSCKGPIGTLSSGQYQFLSFRRTFFAGPVPIDVGVSLSGGYSIGYQLQMCALSEPPQALARVTVTAYAGASASAGVNLLAVRGGVSASLVILDGMLEPKAQAVAGHLTNADAGVVALTPVGLTIPVTLNAILMLRITTLTGRVNAYLQTLGCGWFGLDWCGGYDVELLSWNGPSWNDPIFNLTWTTTSNVVQLAANARTAADEAEASLHAPARGRNASAGAILNTRVPHPRCPGQTMYAGLFSTDDKIPRINVYIQKGSVPKREGDPDWQQADPAVYGIPLDYQATAHDYAGTGFDRGHLVPAQVFNRPPDVIQNTFLYINAAPQYAWFNEAPWRTIECRIARNCGAKLSSVYQVVATGVVGSIGNMNGVEVPTTFWKVVCRKYNDTTYAAWGHYGTNLQASTEIVKNALRTQVYEVRRAQDVFAIAGGPYTAGMWSQVATVVNNAFDFDVGPCNTASALAPPPDGPKLYTCKLRE